jgi:hypothetical protein
MTERQEISEQRETLTRLAAAGIPVDWLSEEQRAVLLELSPAELDLLLDIKARLDDVAPEVQAHSEIAGGALF